jgi:GNAT superfamily N-acetyltransferase
VLRQIAAKSERARFRVALWDGRSVGLAESSHRDQGDRSVRYCKLVVDPEFRRQGIGAALLADLLDIDRGDVEISFQATASTEWSALSSAVNRRISAIRPRSSQRPGRGDGRTQQIGEGLILAVKIGAFVL